MLASLQTPQTPPFRAKAVHSAAFPARASTTAIFGGFDSAAFEKVSTSRRFSEKPDFARDFLPVDLTPAGYPNPIGTLYELRKPSVGP